jgi:hypothetical protein
MLSNDIGELYRMKRQSLVLLSFLALILLLGERSATAATIVPYSVTRDVTDFSASGYQIGTEGYWFANFDAATPVTDAPVNQNSANTLPSWAAVNFNPGGSFPSDNLDGKPYAVSMGGLPGANEFTLPNGTTGGSGQVVDVRMAPGGSDTLLKDVTFNQDTPTSLYFHVILDNVPLDVGSHVDRVRVTYRLPEDGNTIVRALFDILPPENNGIADVYTFFIDGIQDTGYLAIQLRTGTTSAAGMAGFAFDTVLVPEPSGLLLLVCGTVGLALVRRRSLA